MTSAWSQKDATEFLRSREMFGLRPGLERINVLLAALGNPQEDFQTIHVVGTNGKSSTARFAASLLAENGVAAGAFVSPHLERFSERVLVSSGRDLKEIDPDRFAESVELVRQKALEVERSFTDGDLVTQFEIVTAAAFVSFARAGVRVAVIEAGLGGRMDATNVLSDDGVCLLTSVGIDHALWLGEDVISIAREKLAVVGAAGTLVIGDDLDPDVRRLAALVCSEDRRALVQASEVNPGDVSLVAAGEFQRANFSLAVAGVEELLGERLPAGVIARTAGRVVVPGRLQVIAEQPLTLVDCAHNPDGIRALMKEIAGLKREGPTVALIGVLSDKDIAGMLDAMLVCVDSLVVTSPLAPRACTSDQLRELALERGFTSVTEAQSVREGLQIARGQAGDEGVVVACGSVHVAGELLSSGEAREVSGL